MPESPATLVPRPASVAADLMAAYAAHLTAAGYTDHHVRLWGARAFLRRYPDPARWRAAPLAEQLGLRRSLKYFANFLFLTHALRPTMTYLRVARPKLALAGRRARDAEVYAQFLTLGRSLGYADGVMRPTVHFLFYVMAYAGKPAAALTPADLADFEREMRAFQPPPGHRIVRKTVSNHFFRVRQLLYHAGILPTGAVRYQPRPARAREVLWAGIPAPIGQVAWRYLDQLATMRAPDTVTNHEGFLRRFFTWLARDHPEVQRLGALRRPHIEAFTRWLHTAPSASGRPLQRPTVAGTLSGLGQFFHALQEWGWPEAPGRPLVFASDRPTLDEPLPRFLDDDQAAALLGAARRSPDRFTRVCVETLLRTGLRKGEFIRLQVDSVVQIGGTAWLHVPLGKLHTDRYVPLHPDVKRLLDEWLAHRPADLRTNQLFVCHGRPMPVERVDRAVKRAAHAAGLGDDVTPHRLRHTLATQAINRGMSLEAIAALLGHRSLHMTLVYARIADQTVRDQYTAVSANLDALIYWKRRSSAPRPVSPAAVMGRSPSPTAGPQRRRSGAEVGVARSAHSEDTHGPVRYCNAPQPPRPATGRSPRPDVG